MKKIANGHYEMGEYKILKGKFRQIGDTKERTWWKVYNMDSGVASFPTLREARVFVEKSLERED